MSGVELHPGQMRVLELLEGAGGGFRQVCVVAGRGWGKSFLAVHLLAWWALQERVYGAGDWVLWWVSKEKGQAKVVGMDAFMRRFRSHVDQSNQNEGWIRTTTGVRIEFVGTDADPDALRGRNVYGAIWDEPFVCHFPFLETVLIPALRHPDSRLLLIGTLPHVHEDTDPRWYTYIAQAKSEGWLYVGTSRENEGHGLPVGWVDERLREASVRGMEDVARAEYLCELKDLYGKTVWAQANPRVVDRAPHVSRVLYRVVGVDPHLSRPNAYVCVEYTRDGSVYVVDSGYVEQPLENLVRRLRRYERERGPVTHWLIDARMGRQHVNVRRPVFRVEELFLELGLPVQCVDMDVMVWVSDLAQLAGAGRFYVLRSQSELLNQLSTYTAQKVTGKFKKRYLRQYDLVDALRYAMSLRLHKAVYPHGFGAGVSLGGLDLTRSHISGEV